MPITAQAVAVNESQAGTAAIHPPMAGTVNRSLPITSVGLIRHGSAPRLWSPSVTKPFAALPPTMRWETVKPAYGCPVGTWNMMMSPGP